MTDENKIETAVKENPSGEKKVNTSLFLVSGLLVVTVAGIAYLYFNLDSAKKVSSPPVKRKPFSQQENQGEENGGVPQVIPTLTTEEVDIVAKLEDHTITITDQGLSPQDISIKIYDQVTWENEDTETHQITGGSWGDVSITTGRRFTQSFDTPGTYPYSCVLHPELKGTIIVK